MEGTTFGNVPLNCELKLEVWDSPNSAGVVIDAVRCAKLALDRGIGGSLTAPSSYFMKTPPLQYTDDEAHRLTEAFIAGEDLPGIKPRRAPKPEVPKVAVPLPENRAARKPVRNGAGGRSGKAARSSRITRGEPVEN